MNAPVPSTFLRVTAPRTNDSLNDTLSRYCITTTRRYAFIEFRVERDAEDAYYEMHNRVFEGERLSVQWAKNPPSAIWRHERRRSPPSRRRDYSPPRNDYRRSDRRRSRSPDRGSTRRRSRTRSPVDEKRRRSASPERTRDRDRDGGRTPPRSARDEPELARDRERPQTPPFDR